MSLYERSVEFLKNPVFSQSENERYERERELLVAVKSGNLELTRQLIRQGVDVNAKERNGKTCLYYAAGKNDNILARELLSAGANPNCNEKHSPLLNAIESGNTEVAELLIKAQVDTGVPINFKAIFMAVEMKQKDVVKLLLDSESELISPHGETVLYHAIESRLQNFNGNNVVYLDILKLLLNNDASMIHKGLEDKFNPVEALFENGTVANICLFFDYGLKLNDCDVELPLHCAANNQDDVLEFLLENTRFNIEDKDSCGFTVLHKAVIYNNLNNIEILLHHYKANVNTTNFDGETPLLTAVANNFVDCVKMLLEFGACVNLSSGDGKTPFYIAVTYNRPECLEFLVASGAHFEVSRWVFSELADSISFDILKILLRNIALFEFQGREVNSNYYKLVVESNSTKKNNLSLSYLNDCKIELGLMQTSIIHYTTTFYRILTNKFPTYFFTNELVLGILTLESLSDMFPIYAKQIYDTFARAKVRADLKEGAIRGLNRILPFDVRSSYIGENILKYLYRRDLQNLSKLSKRS